MDEAIKNRLSGVFANEEKRKQERDKASKEAADERKANIIAFWEVMDQVAIPAFKEIALELKSNGYQSYLIDSRNAQRPGDLDMSVEMGVLGAAKPIDANKSYPYLKIALSHIGNKLRYTESTKYLIGGGHVRGIDGPALQDLDKAFIQEHLTKLIEGALK